MLLQTITEIIRLINGKKIIKPTAQKKKLTNNDLELLIQKIYDNPHFYTHHGTEGYKRIKKEDIQTDIDTANEFRVFARIDYVLENPEEESKIWFKTNERSIATPELIKNKLNDDQIFVYYHRGSPLKDSYFWIGIKDYLNKDFWEEKEDKITKNNIGEYWDSLSLYDRQILLYYISGSKRRIPKAEYNRNWNDLSEDEKYIITTHDSIIKRINRFNNETISLRDLSKDISKLKKELKKYNSLFDIEKMRWQDKGELTHTEGKYGIVDHYFLKITFNKLVLIKCWINNLGDFHISLSRIMKLENKEYQIDSSNWDIHFNNKLFLYEFLSSELNLRIWKYIKYAEKNYPNFFKQISNI